MITRFLLCLSNDNPLPLVSVATGLSGQKFHFLANGDGPSRYRVLNFRRVEGGHFEWATIGFYLHGNLTLVSIIVTLHMRTSAKKVT